MKTSSEIRQAFLDFFRCKQHQIIPSASMVIKNDPTLMFTNAGMNQFKDIFLGNIEYPYLRVANTQKCLRVSGKHNDLEQVGHDTYHHTMFEMLGNWSFGDYFKKEAIEWAFELLTKVYGISADSMYATYFEGDKTENIEPDFESKTLWEQYLPTAHILAGSKKDNFWEMDDSGPCGPCSEIHLDLRTEEDKKKIPGYKLINTDNTDVIEIWNLVFIQFNRDMHGKLHLLKDKYVDTGLGLERLCRVIQGKTSNYDTDLFIPVIKKTEEISGIKYGSEKTSDVAFRVIADHLRAVAFAVADGQIPSNVKAGYVIRRILRRSVRYGYTFLKLDTPFINLLVPTFIECMWDFFPELQKQQQLIAKVILEEEKSFLKTLQTGIHRFEDYISAHPWQKKLEGKFVFELYDTYGFPVDLTELIGREKGLDIDIDGFNYCMTVQKERSRKDSEIIKEDWIVVRDIKNTEFVGWDYIKHPVRITRYRKIIKKGKEFYQVMFDKTPFYGESGGQCGDTGILRNNKDTIKIIETIKELDNTVHISEYLPKDIETEFMAEVDETARNKIIKNHTATHLMHNALRKVLGSHVEQKGSLVTPDYLRFDFSYFQKMSKQETEQVERIVNADIRNNLPLIENRAIDYDEALKQGAIALFGEKYAQKVRMIRFGDSVELCGGTHVSSTGSIGFFKIISESAIAAGIRRIEAVTGEKATELVLEQWKTLQSISEMFNNPKNILETISNICQQQKKLEKQIEQLENENIRNITATLLNETKNINNINILQKKLSLPAHYIKNLSFELNKQGKAPFFYAIGNVSENKVSVTVIISDDLVKDRNLSAASIVKETGKEIGGSGGGQLNIATAGGTIPQGIDKALNIAVSFIK